MYAERASQFNIYPDLQPGQAVIISGDVTQYYSPRRVGGGVGIILRLNMSIKEKAEKKAEQTDKGGQSESGGASAQRSWVSHQSECM